MSRLAPFVLLAVVLAACSSDPAAAPDGSGLSLDGDDLGVVAVGADFRTAVSAVSAALGDPTADLAQDVVCVASEDEVAWGDLRLASSGGQLAGWLSTRTDLASPEGITVGSTVAEIVTAYGDSVAIRAGTSDSDETFAEQGSGLSGGLTSQAPDGTVTYLYNGVCSPS